VQVLLQLSREGDDVSHRMMLRLAMEKAAQSCDPDLLYGAVSAACDGDPLGRSADIQGFVRLLRELPPDLQVVGDVLAASLQRGQNFDRARAYHEQLGRGRQAACCAVQQVLHIPDPKNRERWLRFAREFFGQPLEAGAPEAERLSMQFGAQVSAEEAELLRAQMELEEKSLMKRWPGGPHRFAGKSLVDTLVKLIALNEIIEADNLRSQLKVSDKKYWRIKVRALSKCRYIEELHTLATCRTSPIGYELFIDAFLKAGRNDLASPFVQRVKNPDLQASYYERMGMEEEAQAARAQRQERAGAGRLLNMFSLR